MSLVGSTLGRYQVQEELGRGGMAVVYKGYHPMLQRTVALKVLKPELAADQEFVSRFRREAQQAARLKHLNIATVYDVESEDDTHYIVMEFLPGHTLQQEVHLHGAPPLARTVEIIRALANALDYAHQQGLIHRDVKPSNVMLGPDGHVTLMDLGIVKAAAGIQLTREGTRIGTPEYMSPEQAQGLELDHRSDIYSLGVVLYEMIVGRVPFQATSSHKVLHSHVHQEPPPPSHYVPSLPAAVEKVVLRSLAKRPKQRFQTAGQMAAALEQAALLPAPVPRQKEAGLVLVASDGREFPLSGVIGLGRSPDNQVQIPDLKISRNHAQIRCEGALCQIVDLGSVNRTMVNNQVLPPHVPCTLRPGDQVRLGPEATFAVQLGTGVEPANQQPANAAGYAGAGQKGARKRRPCGMMLLVGGITLILLFLCLVAALVLTGSEGWNTISPSVPWGEWAVVSVVNRTGHAVELEIGGRHWNLEPDERQTIRFPAGEYRYTITLDTGRLTVREGAWQPGENPELQLWLGGP